MDTRAKLYFLLVLIALFPSQRVMAKNPGFAIYQSHGYLWAHRKTMLPMEAPTRGIDLNMYCLTQQGRYNWTSQYRAPRLGVCFTYLDLGTPDIAGKAFGILPFVEFKLLDKKRHEITARLSSGVGYLTKKWDLETNLKNKAVGSHVNANMRVHFMYHWMITPKIEISAVAGITHFSNANYKMPNLGLNCVEAGLGIGYHLYGKASEIKPFIPDTLANKKRHEIRISGATKVTGLVYAKRIFVGELSYRNFFWCRQKLRISAGIDLFHDKGFLYRDNHADSEGKPTLKNSFETALTLGGEFVLGSLHIITEGGAYLYSPKWNKGLVYQRVGFKYEINPTWAVSSTLKTHFARADYIEWGIAHTIF